MEDRENQLMHLVYEASLDNSLWPELILELTEHLNRVEELPPAGATDDGSVADLEGHFRRAFDISERLVAVQEREAQLQAVLDTFAFGVALLDDAGVPIASNLSMRERIGSFFDPQAVKPLLLACEERGEEPRNELSHWITEANRIEAPLRLRPGNLPARGHAAIREDRGRMMVLPRQEAVRMGFPARAAAVLIAPGAGNSDKLRAFIERKGLSPREGDLLEALLAEGDLRRAAQVVGVTYETARTYLKKIYDRSEVSGQLELSQALARCPLGLLRERHMTEEERFSVRRMLRLPDGRNLEYFMLGPAGGQPVLAFDAMAGVSIDVLGRAEKVLAQLEQINGRIIIPCRPGVFRSSMKVNKSLRDFAPDIECLLDALRIEKVGIFGMSFGVASALGVAHELRGRVSGIVLSAPAYPAYKHPNWRELDLFYQMGMVLGRAWPGMLRQVIPFLVRSIMQNVDSYFDRYAGRTVSPHDKAWLCSPYIRKRIVQTLAARSAQGMDGMVEENLLNIRGWDFRVADITRKVEVYHGTLDRVSPLQAGELLASDLGNARLVPMHGMGHYMHATEWPWMVARAAGYDVGVGVIKDRPFYTETPMIPPNEDIKRKAIVVNGGS